MTDVTFGRLETVDVRAAWTHEALAFTPWLASNLERLGEAIGLPLELERAEAPVGRYSADILARSVRDGGTVLIENQLEVSDHTHLGQIMTYLTGLQAQTIVWVAPDFRDEHRSAIRWLNEHTVDPFAFFAVRVRVVRIGDSAMAPLFEVLEQPNGWDRRVQDVVREAREASSVTLVRRAFWNRFNERSPGNGFVFGSPSSQWLAVPGTDLIVSAWVGEDATGVFIRGGRGQDGNAVAPRLSPLAEQLEARLGVPLGQTLYPFSSSHRADLTDPANREMAIEWLMAQSARYAAVLSDMFKDPA
jgi:hypothetical protein